MSENSLRAIKEPEVSLAEPSWSFLSNHALVMMCLDYDPTMRMRQIASDIGITERAVQRILTELERGGYLQRHRYGRCNHYTVNKLQKMSDPIIGELPVHELLELRNKGDQKGSRLGRSGTMSRAANGTSFGRRRGPVPQSAQSTESLSQEIHGNVEGKSKPGSVA